jgi:hypothetical protein
LGKPSVLIWFKSFRIERIGAVISLSRKNTEDIEEGAIVESPIVDRRKENEQTIVPTTDESDDFDFDITKDMDEILGDDEEEDEEEDVEMTEVPIETSINNGNSNSNNSNNNNNNNNSSESESEEDTFEEISTIPIALPPSYSSHGESVSPMSLPVTPSLPQVVASPSLPTNLQLPGTPIASSSSAAATTPTSSNNTNNTNNTNGSAPTKKRKFKMASAPIRHPGTLSPLPPVPTPPPVSRVDPKKYKSEDDDGSSSGSEESSSGSESGSTESGSSGSESESSSDDDDFESLAQDISLSLSNDGPSVPPSPQHAPSSLNTNGMSAPSPSTYGRSPYSSVNTPTPTRNASGNTGAGPMSLRALFSKFMMAVFMRINSDHYCFF